MRNSPRPQLSPELAAIVKAAGLSQDDLWQHKQSGQTIVYHRALERAAAQQGIVFDPPVIVQADAVSKVAVMVVTGRLGDRAEWSFGEAAPYNTTQTYPFAMAEKRGKDRVILKLLRLHGEVYSEEEADSFKPTEHRASDPAAALEAEVAARLAKIDSLPEIEAYYREEVRPRLAALSAAASQDRIVALFRTRKRELEPPPEGGPMGQPPAKGKPAPAGKGNSRAPYRLCDENGEIVRDDLESGEMWLVEAERLALELRSADDIDSFRRANGATLKRLHEETTGPTKRAVMEFEGVLDTALKNAMAAHGVGPAVTAEDARRANERVRELQEEAPAENGIPF